MRCLDEETLSLVVDGVADASANVHVEGCAHCAARVRELEDLGAAMRSLSLAREAAPASIRATLRGLEAGATGERWRRRRQGIGGLVAAMAAAAVLFVSPGGGGISEALADEAVSRHLRPMARGQICDVETRDPETLERWLQERFARSIEVPVGAGVELVGARRCSLFGEEAGAVIYRSGDATVTMFVPRPGSRAERACARAVGECTQARDGQTVCVVDSPAGPRLLVGELPAEQLGEVAKDA